MKNSSFNLKFLLPVLLVTPLSGCTLEVLLEMERTIANLVIGTSYVMLFFVATVDAIKHEAKEKAAQKSLPLEPSNAMFIPIIFLIGIYMYIWFSKNLEFYIPFFYNSN